MPSLRCLDPTATMEYVDNCPDSKDAWDEAAGRKGCRRISDNCVGLHKQKLEYHCVTNPYMNRTVEVCAPSRRMFGGFCPEYSILAEGVQENFDVDCKTFKKPCPMVFMSTDAYRYQECYTMINRRTTSSVTATSPKTNFRTYSTNSTETKINATYFGHIMAITLGTIALVGIIIILIGTLKYCSKKWKKRNSILKGKENVNSKEEEMRLDNSEYRTRNDDSDSISDPNNPYYCRSDTTCDVYTKQSLDGTVRNGYISNDEIMHVLNTPNTKNEGTRGKTSDG